MPTLILLLLAAICFAVAAARVTLRVELVACGLFFWVLTALIPILS